MPNLTCRASWLLPLLLCLLNDTQIGPSPPLFPVLPCLCPFPGSPPPPHPIPGQSIVCFAPCSVPYSIYWNEEGIILLPFSYQEETTQHPLKYFIFQYQYASEKTYDCQPENKMCLKFWIQPVLPPPPSLPAKALHVSGVLEMSSSEAMDRLCSAEGLLRGGGNGEISVSLVS